MLKCRRIGDVHLGNARSLRRCVRNAIDIGFLAPVPEERIVKVGNAALAGAHRHVMIEETKTGRRSDGAMAPMVPLRHPRWAHMAR